MQTFIEKHVWLLGLDYAALRPRKTGPSGAMDFMLERFDGFHDLLELKSPHDEIIKAPDAAEGAPIPAPHEYSLSKTLGQALAQAMVYRDRLTRYADAANELYGLPHTRDPRLIIVLGRADALPEHRQRVLLELNKSLHRIEVVPYDVLAKRAEAVLDNVELYLTTAAEASATEDLEEPSAQVLHALLSNGAATAVSSTRRPRVLLACATCGSELGRIQPMPELQTLRCSRDAVVAGSVARVGFLSRLSSSRTTTAEAVRLEGGCIVAAVGEASYQPALSSICGSVRWEDVRFDCTVALVPQPSNAHDKNAVMVQCEGKLVGYLSRGDALDYGPAVRRFAQKGKLIVCNARIAGRGPGSETANLGIFLHLPDPEEALRDADE